MAKYRKRIDITKMHTRQSKIIIPEATSIDDFAFDGFTRLKQLIISDSTTTIGKFAFFSCPKDLEITIIASDPYAEKAEDVIKMLPKRYREKVKIEFSPEANQAYVKGDSSSPSFFSPPSEQQDGEPSSNNQNQQGA